MSDALPQAMVLTAVVITFALTAFLLAAHLPQLASRPATTRSQDDPRTGLRPGCAERNEVVDARDLAARARTTIRSRWTRGPRSAGHVAAAGLQRLNAGSAAGPASPAVANGGGTT